MEDIRITRTKNMLLDAFEELIAEKPYEEISVSELCGRSTVRRATFYKHFSCKDEFFQFYLDSITSRFLQDLAPSHDTDDLQTYIHEMHAKLMRSFLGDATMQSLLSTRSTLEIIDKLTEQIAKGIAERALKQAETSKMLCREKIEMLVCSYSVGIVGAIRWADKKKRHVSEKWMVDFCSELFMDGYTKIIGE